MTESVMTDLPTPLAQAHRRPDSQWWLSLGLSLIGLAVSAYLTWIKLTGKVASCGSVGDCESVNSSRYAEIAGIPIALLGALGFLAVLALLVAESRSPSLAEGARLALFGISLIGTLYSAYLSYIEVAVLRAVCPYCVISAIAMTAILVLGILRLRMAGSDA
jgi:uncharacterized membrane protein